MSLQYLVCVHICMMYIIRNNSWRNALEQQTKTNYLIFGIDSHTPGSISKGYNGPTVREIIYYKLRQINWKSPVQIVL